MQSLRTLASFDCIKRGKSSQKDEKTFDVVAVSPTQQISAS